MNKAYRYRLYPDKEQSEFINKTFGCVRFVYKRMLVDRKVKYEQNKDDKEALKKLRYTTPADYKDEFVWLKEVDSLALSNAQLNLNTAYKNFFRDKSISFPKFKSRHKDRKSYTTSNQNGTIRIIDNSHIRIPKLKEVKIKLHRKIPTYCKIKSATISQTTSGKYCISILVEFDAEIQSMLPCADNVIGLDYSSKALYIDNFGTSADYPKYYRKMEAKLKRETVQTLKKNERRKE